MRKCVLLATCFAAAILAMACGGDDSSDATPTPQPSVTGSAGATATPANTPAETGDDSKTPAPEATEGTNESPAETAPGEVPTRRATAPGTPAVAPDDQTAFIAQFAGQDVTQVDCGYDPPTGRATCPGYGLFALQPPMDGQDITCAILIVAEDADALFCRSVSPQTTLYYDIQ